jgi:hypothetical protein
VPATSRLLARDPRTAAVDGELCCDPSVFVDAPSYGMPSSSMDFSRLSSPPSIHVHDCNSNHDKLLTPHTMSGSSFPSRAPMLIPTKKVENFVPPPLPPPTQIDCLENGYDPGWLFANPIGGPDLGKLAPIHPGSSLLGGHRRPEPVPRIDRMSLEDLDGRGKVGSSPQSPKAPLKNKLSVLTDESFQRNPSFTGFSEPM